MHLLEVKNLRVVFDTDDGPLAAVDGVELHLDAGEVLGLVGESGCGKSVTALSLLRLIPVPPGRIAAGEALFQGQDLLHLPIAQLRDLRGRAISMIFQEPMNALSPLHRIGDQLVETLRLHAPDLPRRDAAQQALEWLRRVGLPDPAERMHSYPFDLSGGMLQRVMIAMALMLHPALIVADEPTTALDVTIQAQILDLLRTMKDRQSALLLITHDLGVIWEMCDRVAVMYAGRIVEENGVQAIFERPHHPYTQALLDALPTLHQAAQRLRTIPGQAPSPLAFPAGCRFRERCPYAFARCAESYPPLYATADGGKSACFLCDPQNLRGLK